MSDETPIKVAQECLAEGTWSLFKTLPSAIRRIVEERLWATRLDKSGKPFASFEAFVTARLWHGLEIKDMGTLLMYLKESPDVVRIVQGEVPLMPTNSESKVGNQNAVKNDGNNITVVSERTRGTDLTYLLARMKRDAPEVAQDYLDGKHKSIRAAAIVAGIIKVPSNYEQAIKAIGKLTPDELLMLKEYLGA